MVLVFVFSQLTTSQKPETHDAFYRCYLEWESKKSRPSQGYQCALVLSFRPILYLSFQVEYDGLTGRVEFNSKGQRTNYSLHILEKHKLGHKQVTFTSYLDFCSIYTPYFR